MASRRTYAEKNAASIRRYGKSLYERRVDAGDKAGRTRQFARGHGYKLPGQPTEYKKRKLGAISKGELIPTERAFVLRQAKKSDRANAGEMMERFRRYSPNQRKTIMATQASLHRRYVAAGRPKGSRIIPRGVPGMESAGQREVFPGVVSVPGIGYAPTADFAPFSELDEEDFEELYPDFEDDWLDEDSPFIWYH